MSSNSIAVELGIVSGQINRYYGIILFVTGIIGNLINCIVFTRRTLRSTPCCIYFLVASLMDFIVILLFILPRTLLAWKAEYDLAQTNSIICKSTLFLVFSARAASVWLIAFATVDRYLVSSTNNNRRQMSNLKNTYICITLICICTTIAWSELLYCYDANVVGTPQQCYPKSDICRIYNNFNQVLTIVLFPTILMCIFGIATIRNIHSNRRIIPINQNIENNHARNRRRENSLTKMLISQVVIYILCGLPFATMAFYISFTYHYQKSIIQSAIESFIFNILLFSAYAPNCISFFLFTLTGSIFREVSIDITKKILRFLKCYH